MVRKVEEESKPIIGTTAETSGSRVVTSQEAITVSITVCITVSVTVYKAASSEACRVVTTHKVSSIGTVEVL